nr:MAG TPA: hypothetical protein [Caudoviricetes sp.]
MPKWTEYTTKETLADNDEVMLYDATARANKRGLMSKFWDYVVDKMATAVISKLETKNKTVIGAINALNSGRFGRGFPNNTDSFYSCQPGAYFLSSKDYQTIPDKPSGASGRAIWIYTWVGDERIGLFISAMGGKTMVGQCYGGTSLTWKEL